MHAEPALEPCWGLTRAVLALRGSPSTRTAAKEASRGDEATRLQLTRTLRCGP